MLFRPHSPPEPSRSWRSASPRRLHPSTPQSLCGRYGRIPVFFLPAMLSSGEFCYFFRVEEDYSYIVIDCTQLRSDLGVLTDRNGKSFSHCSLAPTRRIPPRLALCNVRYGRAVLHLPAICLSVSMHRHRKRLHAARTGNVSSHADSAVWETAWDACDTHPLQKNSAENCSKRAAHGMTGTYTRAYQPQTILTHQCTARSSATTCETPSVRLSPVRPVTSRTCIYRPSGAAEEVTTRPL